MQLAKTLTSTMALVLLSMNYALRLRLYLFVFTARPEYTWLTSHYPWNNSFATLPPKQTQYKDPKGLAGKAKKKKKTNKQPPPATSLRRMMLDSETGLALELTMSFVMLVATSADFTSQWVYFLSKTINWYSAILRTTIPCHVLKISVRNDRISPGTTFNGLKESIIVQSKTESIQPKDSQQNAPRMQVTWHMRLPELPTRKLWMSPIAQKEDINLRIQPFAIFLTMD